jgi:predicted amidophosphoribosyltransferase
MKYAYWLRRTHLLRADEYLCSACGAASGRVLKRCPACGALMKKTKYEPSWADEAESLAALLDDDF